MHQTERVMHQTEHPVHQTERVMHQTEHVMHQKRGPVHRTEHLVHRKRPMKPRKGGSCGRRSGVRCARAPFWRGKWGPRTRVWVWEVSVPARWPNKGLSEQ